MVSGTPPAPLLLRRLGTRCRPTELLQEVQRHGLDPHRVPFIALLKECSGPGALSAGKQAHAHIVDRAMSADVGFGAALITFYDRCCARVADARRAFENLHDRNVICWTAILAAYARRSLSLETLDLFLGMLRQGVNPNAITFVSMLNACSSPETLPLGKCFHAHAVDCGATSIVVHNALISMYGKCRSISDARVLFRSMGGGARDEVTWNAAITVHAELQLTEDVAKLYCGMLEDGRKLGKCTFLGILKACVSSWDLPLGKGVHANLIGGGLISEIVLETALLSMYGRCGRIDDVERMFDKLPHRNLFTWTAMISAYAQYKNSTAALKLLHEMIEQGLKPDNIALIGIIRACVNKEALRLGKQAHSCAIDKGIDLESDTLVATSLISMYGKCGSHEDALQIFYVTKARSVITWTAIITAFAQHGDSKGALELFHEMQQEGVVPNEVTFTSILNACRCMDALAMCKDIHVHLVDLGYNADSVVMTALLASYSECSRSIKDAAGIFAAIGEKSVFSWTAMIGAYVRQGLGHHALSLFCQMKDVKPNEAIFANILQLCLGPTFMGLGKQLHAITYDERLESDAVVGNALLSMYSRCGSIKDVQNMFNRLKLIEMVSWNILITTYAHRVSLKEALDLVIKLKKLGLRLNKKTFLSIIDNVSGGDAFGIGKQIHGYVLDLGLESDEMVANSFFVMYETCKQSKKNSCCG